MTKKCLDTSTSNIVRHNRISYYHVLMLQHMNFFHISPIVHGMVHLSWYK